MSDIPEFKGDGTCGANLTTLMTQFQSGVQELNTRLQNCEKAARYKELLAPEDSELILLRFLIGKGNDVEVAWTAFEKSMEWRDEHKSNLVPDIDDEKYEANVPHGKVIPTYVPELNFNGASKSGLPLAFELKGRIDIHGLIKAVTPEQYSQHLAWSLIASTRKMNKMSREQDKLLATALVMCCKNVSTAHLKYLPYFKYEVDWSQLNCPELLGEAIVVNTPWFFNMIWQIVKPWLDKRTLQKVHILGGKNSERDLQELVDAKYIPVALGGSDPAAKMVIPDPTKGMSKVDLGAGKKHTIELKADKANLTINWKWKPVGRDVGFSVTFIDEEGVDDQVVDYEKFSASGEVYDGSFLTSRAGVMRFEWDNSYSYFTGKTFMYIVGEFEELQLQ